MKAMRQGILCYITTVYNNWHLNDNDHIIQANDRLYSQVKW